MTKQENARGPGYGGGVSEIRGTFLRVLIAKEAYYSGSILGGPLFRKPV